MLTRDIHSNKESVVIALYDLHESIMLAKRDKDRLLCLIVGYGSKGTRHKIQTSVMDKLEEYLKNNTIKGYIRGNQIDIFDRAYQSFPYKDRIPEEDKKRKNPGAIYIAV